MTLIHLFQEVYRGCLQMPPNLLQLSPDLRGSDQVSVVRSAGRGDRDILR